MMTFFCFFLLLLMLGMAVAASDWVCADDLIPYDIYTIAYIYIDFGFITVVPIANRLPTAPAACSA
jgi:hypothetical protein